MRVLDLDKFDFRLLTFNFQVCDTSTGSTSSTGSTTLTGSNTLTGSTSTGSTSTGSTSTANYKNQSYFIVDYLLNFSNKYLNLLFLVIVKYY